MKLHSKSWRRSLDPTSSPSADRERQRRRFLNLAYADENSFVATTHFFGPSRVKHRISKHCCRRLLCLYPIAALLSHLSYRLRSVKGLAPNDSVTVDVVLGKVQLLS